MRYRRRGKRPCPIAISESLERVMEKIDPGRGRFLRISALWKEMMQEDFFLNARPTSVRRSVLHVTVSDPVWQSELRFYSGAILERINSVLKEKERITDIHYHVGVLGGPPPGEESRKAAGGEAEADADTEVAVEDLPADLREAVMKVSDPSLRAIVARIARTLERRREK